MKHYYLAYGSNLNLQQMKFRCRGSKCIGTTLLNGYRLAYKGGCDDYAYLTIEESKEHYVPLGIYQINIFDMLYLDAYEGYPDLYLKKYLTVDVGGKSVKALIYIMKDQFDYHIPSKEYIKTCEQGYENFNFDKSLLDDAYNFSKELAPKELKKRNIKG